MTNKNIKKQDVSETYLVNHVNYVTSQENIDAMYIELLHINLIDHMTQDSNGKEYSMYNNALKQLLRYEERLESRSSKDIEKDVRFISFIGDKRRSNKSMKTVPVIAKIEKSLTIELAETQDIVPVETDIRFVTHLST